MDVYGKPIGVFDSGVGGISVLKKLYELMPNENYIYFGDSLNAPYGDKSDEEIFSLTKNAVDHLIKRGVKAVVIACNTATSVAAKALREEYSLPVIGIEPAVKPASLSHRGEKIIVMATPVTLKREKYNELVCTYEKDAQIISLPCPQLAQMIEKDAPDKEITEYLERLFLPYKDEKIAAIVLGCTHYPHILHLIKKSVGKDAKIYDGGEGTARETKRLLGEMGILTKEKDGGVVEFENSKSDIEETQFMKKLFER